MLKVEDMSPTEMHALLQREGFGHLGCARDGRPYVVPMHYAYDGKELYFFTTQGMKTRYIHVNPQVCLQVEEIIDSINWRSVMVVGQATELTLAEETQRAMKLITERNPSLAPAISSTQVDSLGRAVDIAIYSITPEVIDGRQTVPALLTDLLIRRRKFHRLVFIAAGIYNIAWGIHSIYDPQWLFRFAGMPLLNHPAIFACLGMVVGLYGIIYLEVARLPERGWLLAAVGLVGKILGPIGLAQLIWSGAWPKSTIVLCLTNDVIWWIPFALYLHDSWPAWRLQSREP